MIKLFLIIILFFQSGISNATCSPKESLILNRPGKNSPDCVSNSSRYAKGNYKSCSEYLSKYNGDFAGTGKTECVSTPENNSVFSPKAKIKVKQCIFGVCYNKDATIEINKCAWIDAYRYCARLTPHDKAKRPVFTNWSNPPSFGNSCQGQNENDPYPLRICVFEDPMDGSDTNSDSSPHHEKEPANVGALESYATMGAMFGGPIGAIIGGFFGFSKSINNFIVVGNVGCVDVPLAPGPPPYCPTINYFAEANIARICSENENPSLSNNCVLGKMINNSASNFRNQFASNNFFSPSVRISFSQFINKCSNSVNSNCVNFKNINQRKDLVYIKACSVNDLDPCADLSNIKSKIPLIYNNEPFRVVYNILNDKKQIINQGEWKDLSGIAGLSKEISGINIGDYRDLHIKYENASNDPIIGTNPTSSSSELVSYSTDQTQIATSRSFELCVDPAENNLSSQSSNLVNEVNAGKAVSLYSFERENTPKPLVGKCGSTICGQKIDCDSTPTDPKIVVCLGEKINDTEKNCQCSILSKDESNPDSAPIYYLHGAKFEVLITDDNYANWRAEYPDIKKIDNNAEYTGGLEYDGQKYIRGGTKICVLGYSDPNNKILVKMKKIAQKDGKIEKLEINSPSSDEVIKIASFDPKDKLTITKHPDNKNTNYYESGDYINSYSGRILPPLIPQVTLGQNQLINPNTEILRSFTALEENLCIDISQPTPCPSEDTAVYIWSEAKPGATQNGKCKEGYSSKNGKLPSRLCIPQSDQSIGGKINNPCTAN